MLLQVLDQFATNKVWMQQAPYDKYGDAHRSDYQRDRNGLQTTPAVLDAKMARHDAYFPTEARCLVQTIMLIDQVCTPSGTGSCLVRLGLRSCS
jgi:hypothetical protein